MQYKTKWNSLSDFKHYLETNTSEEIVSFNGYELLTRTTKYGLAFGKLMAEEIKKPSKRKTKKK